MDFIGPLLDIVVKIFWSPISKCVKYHRSLDESMEILKQKLEDLNRQKADIESEIRVGIASRKIVKEQVKHWLEEVQRINDDKYLELEVVKGKYLSRARFGKCAAKKIQEIEELHQKASSFNGLMVDAAPVGGERFATTTIVGETTAIRKREEIWTSLISDDNRKIGVFGMAGIGKTTIMKHIHNRILEKDHFDNAIWTTVSRPIDLIKLQGDIARALKLDIEGIGDVDERAKKLFEELTQNRRWVIIFDDMWETFNLEDVGIPEPTVDNGCKLILTTRSQEVCRGMNFKCVKLELLSEDEAWNLFLDYVGRDVIQTQEDLEAIAKHVAKECAGLPLAIVTIGRSMNNVVDRSEWRNVLRELKMSRKGFNEMEIVIERVKLSYTRLKDEKLQGCLLYCALYPEGFKIPRDEVITYLIAEKIVEGIASWQQKCDEGNTILNKLEYACLLESCTYFVDNNCVQIHDIVRDMALQIMGLGSMVKAREKLREFPDTKEWKEDLERVSLMNNLVEEIFPKASPMCSRLETLLLGRNKGLVKIPDSFFVHMPSLRLLDISQTEIQLLPDSISELEHLTKLRLEGCFCLKYVPSLAKLKGTLRVLSLGYTAIEELPQGLEMAVNLEYLDLFDCRNLTVQTGILSKLIRLQCLRVSFRSENPNVAEEIASMRKLETLVVHFSYSDDFNTYVRSLRLQQRRLPDSFFLIVGPLLKGSQRIWALPGRIWVLPGISQPCKYIGMASEDDMELDPNLLLLPKDDDVHELTIGMNVKLRSLCDVLIREEVGLPSSPLQPMSTFFCLRKLDIYGNDHIKKLFTPQLMPLFQNLKEIWVERCSNLEEIFSGAEGDDEEEEVKEEEIDEGSSNNNDALLIPITFPKLMFLSLHLLPKLKSITSRRGIMVCNSIQFIRVIYCPKLKRLPLSLPVHDDGPPSPPPSLTQIFTDSSLWWDSLEWDNPIDKDVLQSFLRIKKLRWDKVFFSRNFS